MGKEIWAVTNKTNGQSCVEYEDMDMLEKNVKTKIKEINVREQKKHHKVKVVKEFRNMNYCVAGDFASEELKERFGI